MKRRFFHVLLIFVLLLGTLSGCNDTEAPQNEPLEEYEDSAVITVTPAAGQENGGNTTMTSNDNLKALFEGQQLAGAYKGFTDSNPIITQSYGADPYAMVYNGRVYFYMTADNEDYDASGNLKENGYGQIKSIRIVSTDDFVNYEDHGEVIVAGPNGACKWANNSWAPAACWKTIDGKDKFFLYFADSGNGIGVLSADSPYGPFTDPLGHAIINRSTPNCANVIWLFDPAVLVDDDGTGYLYVGGGVPQDNPSHPGTGRCVRLTDDMIHLDCDPVVMDTPYLFEDSGIHKFNNKYYYSYCTNFNVDAAGTEEYGFQSGEIAVMVSDNPLGPFVYQERVLKNPGSAFGLGGNNHHCIFSFNGQWYITYHARTLEKAKQSEKGYRSTHVNAFTPSEDGIIGTIKMDLAGVEQLKHVDAYSENSAVCGSILAGVKAIGRDEVSSVYKCGKMVLSDIDSGDYLLVRGVDFGETAPKKLVLELQKTGELSDNCAFKLAIGKPFKEGQMYGDISAALKDADAFTFITAEFECDASLTGVNDIYLVFHGSGFEVKSWKFQ